MRCLTDTLTMYSETVPPHEMSHLTIEKLQYGQTLAQESLPPSPHLRPVPTPASTHFTRPVLLSRHGHAFAPHRNRVDSDWGSNTIYWSAARRGGTFRFG